MGVEKSGRSPRVSQEINSVHNGEVYPEDEKQLNQGEEPGLAKTLKTRHMMMFSIGTAIGMGLWLGSGTSLRNGGPAGIFIGYFLAGTMAWAVNQSVGELAIMYPMPSAFSQWANNFVDRSFGFTVGWAYWFSSTITLANELQSLNTIVRFWTEKIPPVGWISIFLFIVFCIAVTAVTVFGEIEVVFSTVKLFWMVVVIVACIVISAGGGPNHHHTGFQYWNDMPFTNGFKGFLSVMGTCIFSMQGTEIAGVTAAEAESPRKAVPKAVNSVWLRLGLFYLAGSLMITITVSPENSTIFGGSGTNASPYVVAFRDAGITGLAHAMNAIIFISVLSCANGEAYCATRTLVGLSEIGCAPRFLSYCDRTGRPWASILCTFLIGGGLSYLGVNNSGSMVFQWFSNLTTLCILWVWGSIFISHLRFRLAWKLQGRDVKDLAWRTWTYPYGAIWGLTLCVLLAIVQFYLAVWPLGSTGEKQGAEQFFANWISGVALIVFYLCARIYFRGRWWRKLDDIDLDKGLKIYPREDEESSSSNYGDEGSKRRTFGLGKVAAFIQGDSKY
ncbi:hypothetical protein KEM55_008992 [Ascosphaera atra]|nr:hypothetical protein KEM55_008992 [Ascosphaera atra]